VLLERCLLLHGVPAGPLVEGAQEDLQEAGQAGGQGVRGGGDNKPSLKTKSKCGG